MLERKCVKSYRPLQHRNSVTRYDRLITSRVIMFGRKQLAVNAYVGMKIRLLCTYRLKASHCFIHWFDAINFCERNKDQTT